MFCSDQSYSSGVTIKEASPDSDFRLLLTESMMSDACTAAAADEASVLGKYLTCQSKGASTTCAFEEVLPRCEAKASNTHINVFNQFAAFECKSRLSLYLCLTYAMHCIGTVYYATFAGTNV